jgi:hypothetical protein
MGIKTWLTRNTQTPSDYAGVFSKGLEELIEHFAASLVLFSGSQPVQNGEGHHQVAFEDEFAMVMSGFRIVSQSQGLTDFIQPSPATLQEEKLFPSAYRAATAFLTMFSDNTASSKMGVENAELFGKSLHTAVAIRSAGKFGFDPEPRNTFATIQTLIPNLVAKKILNEASFGVDDGLGKILQHLSLSTDGKTRYAFLVGSKRNSFGCAAAYLKVLSSISDNIQRCAQDLHW